MAVHFPSYVDSLVEDFPPPASKAVTFPPREYIEESQNVRASYIPPQKHIEDSQNVREILEKLFGHLSILLFRMDKKMNEVLIQGRRLPKKLNQWAMEARAMKCQVHDLLEEQQNRKGNSHKHEEWIQIGIGMINLLKKCPFEDDMYDKPTPVIMQIQESRSEKPSRRLGEEKPKVEETLFSHLEAKKMEREQSFSSLTGHGVEQDHGSGTSDTSFPAAELPKKNVFATPIDKFESGPLSVTAIVKVESSDMPHAAISMFSSADPKSSSISEYQNEQQFEYEITEEGEQGESEPTPSKAERSNEHEEGTIGTVYFQENDHSSTISSAGPNSSYILEYKSEEQFAREIIEESEQAEAEPTHSKAERSNEHEEGIIGPVYFQENDHSSTISSAGPNSSYILEYKSEEQFAQEIIVESEQAEAEPTHSKAERSNEHQEGITSPISFQEKHHYSVVVEDNNLILNLDNQSHIILIQDYPSAPSLYRPPVRAMLDLSAQDLRELKEKSNYPNLLFLFLQRNNRLTSINSAFFDTMPDLRFLDISDTKIRILPISLFKLSELKVLLLRNCICLEKLQGEIKNLNNIEALDLLGTELYDLPDEIGQLTLLKSLKLSFYGPDDESEYEHLPSQLISPGFLSNLKELQALSISVHPEDHRWTEIAAQMLKDISKLETLNYLEFYFPEVKMFEEFIEMSTSLKKQKLGNFHFIVGQNVKRIVSRLPDEVESLFNQQERRLRYVNGDKASPWIKTMLIHVEAFYLDHHTEAQSLSEFTNLQALKFCIVRECPKIRAILDGKNDGSAFPSLEYLGIYFLWELNHIWKPHSMKIWKKPKPSENFKVLRYLIINTCPKLQFILWESMLYSLANLEELIVEDCERVEKIIKAENKKVKHMDNVFPRLRKLALHYLPELVSVGNGVHLSEEKVTFNGCPKFVLNSEPPR